MSEGWVKLHREIADHWIWKDPERLRAWLDLIMLANHKQKKVRINNEIVLIEVGQRWTSLEKLANRWNWSVGRVRTFLKLLESDDMITKFSTQNGTLITIVNYSVYQGFDATEKHTDKQAESIRSNKQKAYGQTTNKNDIRMKKNEKKAFGNNWLENGERE